MVSLLEFESDLRPLESQLDSLREREPQDGQLSAEEARLQGVIDARLRDLYSHLSPWQKVQVARHRERPYTLDYIQWALTDWIELHGDRAHGDDRALIGGPGLLDGRAVMLIGMQKGRDTRENVERNFGMPHPEGYRKAERLMRQAERLGLPIVTLVDVPGASAGLADEERGQAEAIASCLATMLDVRVPTVSVIIGEGGSGGALAIGVADRILMLEHSIFSVVSPEGAAAILWRDSGQATQAAATMRITARDLVELGLVDGIVDEPVGGAHRDYSGAALSVAREVGAALQALAQEPLDRLLERRYHKYRDIGFYLESS